MEGFPLELQSLGWNSRFSSDFEKIRTEGMEPARVIAGQRESCTVSCAQGELRAEVSGRYRSECEARSDFPVVGDWVAIVPRPRDGWATIHALIPRFNAFARRASTGWSARNGRAEAQVVAANLDVAIIVMGLDRDFNVRRLERYVTLSWGSGVQPLVVLNKADLCEECESRVAETEKAAAGVTVLAASAETGQGIGALHACLRPAATADLLGSSGVGKSTLINRLLGNTRRAIGAVREDDGRGRHTTTHREMIILPSGALLIDNPGMREVGLWGAEDDLDASFADVAALARACRFSDCRHDTEPGCMVRAALQEGSLDESRFEGWHKLQKELAHLATLEDPRAREAHRQLWKSRAKMQKKIRKDMRA
jgi:ribosome biogenesis GTPase